MSFEPHPAFILAESKDVIALALDELVEFLDELIAVQPRCDRNKINDGCAGADDVRKILGGLGTVIEGIGSLRTHGGDAHGRERGYTRIDPRVVASLFIRQAHLRFCGSKHGKGNFYAAICRYMRRGQSLALVRNNDSCPACVWRGFKYHARSHLHLLRFSS